MFPMSTKQGGNAVATGPDTCKTPTPGGPVPTPYPNTTMLMQANPGTLSKKVKVLNQGVVTKATMIPTSTGDEAGTAGGGIVSNMIKGPVSVAKGSTKVKVEGQPAVHQTCPTKHNGTSANVPAGSIVSPSQSKVIVGG
jgi:hypothetical protein